jgi:hypothetical protein
MRYSPDDLQMMARSALTFQGSDSFKRLVDRLVERTGLHRDDVVFKIRLLAA